MGPKLLIILVVWALAFADALSPEQYRFKILNHHIDLKEIPKPW